MHGVVVRKAKPVHHGIDVLSYFEGANSLLNEFDTKASGVHELEGVRVDGDEVSRLDFLYGLAMFVVGSRLTLLC
jgi:hypothetical protein